MNRKAVRFTGASLVCLLVAGCRNADSGHSSEQAVAGQTPEVKETDMKPERVENQDELKKKLTPEQYYVCIQKGTERPFANKYWNNHAAGTYRCAVCGQELFVSDTKFDSGSGWPSFYKPAKDAAVSQEQDRTHGMVRTEVTCSKCGAHLGHVFDDGPRPTGLRYCINSASLDFKEKQASSQPADNDPAKK